MIEILYRVTFHGNGPVFGFVVRGGVVCRAAPVGHWAVGKPWPLVRTYYRRQRRCRLEMVEERDVPETQNAG